MTPPIDRVRYYDGEYLRAFDFADEQAYHMEMRRRLNMALHLSGIVEGLDISQDTQAGITQYSIEPGMAIDPYGREILVFAPYVLDESVLAANRITASGIITSGNYELWIRYRKQAATPPSTGYTSCNGSNEFTRWQEGFDVRLIPTRPAGSSLAVAPKPIDPQSDDPATDGLGVQLGIVHVTNAGGLVSIDDYKPINRTYIGLRAQRIVCPVDPTSFDILKQQDARTPATSLDLQPNVFIDQNLIVGDDFQVDKGTIQPQPPTGFPNRSGNAKVAADMFLQGELYTRRMINNPPAAAWLSLGAYVKTLLPDIQVGSRQVVIGGQATASPATGAVNFTLPSRLTQIDPGRVQVFASIKHLEFNPNTIPNTQWSIDVAGSGVANNSAAGATCQMTLSWTAGPSQPPAGPPPPFVTPWITIQIAYVVILYPAP